MTKPIHTKTFKSGNSVAVRLPTGFSIPAGAEVELDRTGEIVTMRLLRDPAREKARLLEWLDELAALEKPVEIEKREPIEFPDRPGLY